MNSVLEFVSRLPLSDLTGILRVLDGRRLLGPKSEMAVVVADLLLKGDLQTIYEKSDPIQKAALAETIHNYGGVFYPERFRAKYGRYPERVQKDFKTPAEVLSIFLRAGIPGELRERLAPIVPPPEPSKIKTCDALPEAHLVSMETCDEESKRFKRLAVPVPIEIRETERTAQLDLNTMLRLIDDGRIAVSQTKNRPTEKTTLTIADALEGGDYYRSEKYGSSFDPIIGAIKPVAWPLMLREARLASGVDRTLRLTDNGRAALSAPPHETISRIWEGWVLNGSIDEFKRIENIKGQGAGRVRLTPPSVRRSAVCAGLKFCPVGEWVKFDDFLALVRAEAPQVQVCDFRPSTMYIGERGYGGLGFLGELEWDLFEGRYMLCLLMEYAATLGLVDIAFVPPADARPDFREVDDAGFVPYLSRYDGLLYFRLNALGAYCLGLAETYSPDWQAEGPVLEIRSNLRITALNDFMPKGDQIFLDACAVRVSEREWTLDRARLLQAADLGKTVAELREFLNGRAGGSIAEGAEYFLADVEDRISKFVDRGPARVIECRDPGLLELIVNHDSTKKFCMAAGGQFIVVFDRHEARFKAALKKLGYLPGLRKTGTSGI